MNENQENNNMEDSLQRQREEAVKQFRLEISEDDLNAKEENEIQSYSEAYRKQCEEQKTPAAPVQPTEPPKRPTRKEKRIHKRKAYSFLYTVLYLLIVGIIVGVLSKFIIDGAYDLLAAKRPSGQVTIQITPENTEDEVIEMLSKSGAIQNEFFFKLYAKVTKAKYNAGTYTIATNLDYEAIINSLQSTENRSDTVKLTFIEGETAEEIARKLEAANVCKADDFLATLNDTDFTNYKFIKQIDNKYERAYWIEGYLFPDTYEFYLYEKPKTVIKRFLNNVNNKLTKEMYDRAEKLNMTIGQIWTLASIIQCEAGTVEDMYLISSVFHNRLENWGTSAMLQSDVTVFYEQARVEKFPRISGKYNTYEFVGIPAGPICNPGMDAIKAALYPKQTNNYYFVADANGKTYYASTMKQHEYNISVASSVKKS